MKHSDTNLSNEEWLNLNRNSLSPEVIERFESVLDKEVLYKEDSDCIIKKLENQLAYTEDELIEYQSEVVSLRLDIDELSETIGRLEDYIRDINSDA